MLIPYIQDGKFLRILDDRYDIPVDITDGTGRFGALAYTLTDQDLNEEETPAFIPFLERYAGYDDDLTNREFGTELKMTSLDNGIILDLHYRGEKADGVGIFLPLNFMSQKNGCWQQQFTISSPYHTADRAHYLYYLQRPDKVPLVCVVENEIDSYQINYMPGIELSGHFIRGITFWARLDRAYGRPGQGDCHIRVHILQVNSFREAMENAGRIWDMPGVLYEISNVKAGMPFRFETFGIWDEIHITAPDGSVQRLTQPEFTPFQYGYYTAVPYLRGRPGMDCTLFCFDSLDEMHRRSCESIYQDPHRLLGYAKDSTPVYYPASVIYRGEEDHNLNEHCMWALSALEYLLRGKPQQRLVADVQNLLRIVHPENGFRLPGCSYDPKDNYETACYSRIQEPYNGVSILLAAYRCFGDEKYLDLAKTVLRHRLAVDQHEDGGLYQPGMGSITEDIDYTTVTCMVIPIVDMALELTAQNDPMADYLTQAAIRMADHVVSRGQDFPTEGGFSDEVDTEMEEGSMSCAALTVLYVASKLIAKPEYLQYARETLNNHDAFTVWTQHPCMYRSSLRWWETIWEGDSDGPAVCFGHAWSIWRAEAEYYYALLTMDDDRLLDSWNCFMSNLSKTQPDGSMYAIYQYERISSGDLTTQGKMMDRSDREGFPRRKDLTLSRYAYARAARTWMDTTALVRGYLLGGSWCEDCIIPESGNLRCLYIGEGIDSVKIRAVQPFRILCSRPVTVSGTDVLTITTVFED